MAKLGDLRVYWIADASDGIDRFHFYDVMDFEHGFAMLNLLAQYDLHLESNGLRSDYENNGGLEVFDGENWVEWNQDDNIDDFEMPSTLIH